MKRKKIKIIFEGKDPLIKIITPLEQLFEDFKKNEHEIFFLFGFMCGCVFSFLLSILIILVILF